MQGLTDELVQSAQMRGPEARWLNVSPVAGALGEEGPARLLSEPQRGGTRVAMIHNKKIN